ncbi:hypothetical protein FISHEDRAFT_70002 [Fistulina hepatica ATCC 64428]|uniref:Luciferase domain-containing protein n=1 Tax=Fistulina hepatica ATCC 64428 TaxID=1128425 RepID=A0A0D7AKP7_9AGAR|nr:hypothetical protein FISHEDRAFT_70002 [Fistulina hepatica ATCC 64428]
MNAVSSKAQSFLTRAFTSLPGSARERMLAVACTACIATTAFFYPAIRKDYQAYMSLGPGGFPHNVVGWLASCFSGLFGRETTSVECYDAMPEKRQWLTSPLPQRVGERPKTGKHCIPHRQIDQFVSSEFAQSQLHPIIPRVHAKYSSITTCKRSQHERRTDALFLAPDVPAHRTARKAWLEIAHMHETAEYSLHVVLAPRDCIEVISKGWGERHPVSGFALPVEYLFIYTPRTEEEIAVVERIIEAAVGFMANLPLPAGATSEFVQTSIPTKDTDGTVTPVPQ